MYKKILAYSLCIVACCLNYNLHAQILACPQNLDFEDGNLSNWIFYTGNCCPSNTTTLTTAVPGRHDLTTGPGVDPICGIPVVAPNGGQHSLKLGNSVSGAQAERARYYVQVPSNPNNIYTLLYSYAVVFQDPGHPLSDQPRFEVTVFDSATGAPVPCNDFQFVATSSLPGFQRIGQVLYKDWSTASIDLSPMAGTTVGIDFTTADCGFGGHFGYAYVDVACNFFQSYTLHCLNVPNYTLEGPPGFQSYDWRDGNGNTIGTTQNITVPTPPNNAQFSLIVYPFTGFGCPDTIYSDFTISNMTIDVSLDSAICAGESIQLNSGTSNTAGPHNYTWSPAAGLSCINCDNPLANPSVTTKYYITVTDKDGCVATDSVRVRVDEPVTVNLSVGDTFCANDFVKIKNDFTNPVNTQYLWNVSDDNGTIVNGLSSSVIDAVWRQQGLKKIKLTAFNGRCIDEDSVYTFIEYTPEPQFEIFKNVCVGVPTSLIVLPVDGEYIWTIDEQSIPEITYQSPIPLVWNTPGRKKISLTTKSENGCFATKEAYIGIHEYPAADISVLHKDKLCKGKTFELQANQDYRYDYSWRPPQYFNNNVTSKVTGTAEKSGFVYVDVTNQWDCMSTDSFWVDAEPCCDIFMPDAFTPDNNALNDTYWSPDLNKHTIVHFMIANRRGQVVYETKSQDGGWDGTFKGKPAVSDTYNYYIIYKCNDEEEITKKGTVILMR